MITEQEALDIFRSLKTAESCFETNKDSKSKRDLDKVTNIIIDKFGYLVKMKSSRYKKYSNYDDLNQDGFEALVKGLKTYNPAKGSIFWWLHKYIDIKIARSANKHLTIKYPLKIAKENIPVKEQLTNKTLKAYFDNINIEPDIENKQIMKKIKEICNSMGEDQRSIFYDHFGLSMVNDPKTTKQISIEKKTSKKNVEASIKTSLDMIKNIIM
jgi:RNA polymerase sigma factor (sigma-70 family)